MSFTNRRTYRLFEDDSINITNPFCFSLGEEYTTYKQIITQSCISTVDKTVNANDKAIVDGLDGDSSSINPVYYTRAKCRDTSLGGNDTINCPYGYCYNDDIGYKFTQVASGDEMGRVYSENIDDYQRILYLAFGTPVYNSLRGFYNKAVDSSLTNLMMNGPSLISFSKIGRLLGWAGGKLISLPLIPLVWLEKIYKGMTQIPINKYYDFKNQMPLYYRMVNTLLVQVAANLGFRDYEYQKNKYGGSNTSQTGSVTSNLTENQLMNAVECIPDEVAGYPDFVSRYKLDMFRIMHRTAEYQSIQLQIGQVSTDIGLAQQSMESPNNDHNGESGDSETSYWKNGYISGFWNAYKDQLYSQALYIGFRIDKTVDASESLSNSIGDSEIKSTLNSKFAQMQNATFSVFNGNLSDGIIGGMLQGAITAAGNFGAGVVEGLTGVSGASEMATGATRLDIPQIWQDSSFSKSYSFKFEFRTPYGDSVSIMQNLYLPYFCLLVGACPRASGASSYTSPFLCQAYVRGMFSVSLGMIDSLNVTRGADQHGWASNGLPTSLTVSFSIKDMSPAMYPTIGDGFGIFDTIVGNTSPMQEYMQTLSGLGLVERISINSFQNLRRRWKIMMNVDFSTKFNPAYYGSVFGAKSPAKFLFNIFASNHQTNR